MPAKLVETAWLQNKGITSQLFTAVSIQVEKSLGTKLKIPSEIKLPLSKRGHFFNAQKNLRRSADPHKSPKT